MKMTTEMQGKRDLNQINSGQNIVNPSVFNNQDIQHEVPLGFTFRQILLSSRFVLLNSINESSVKRGQ